MSWVFFPENHDKTDEVSAEIAGSLKFGILSLYKRGQNPAPDFLMKISMFV